MENTIRINAASTVKITRIKPWAIYFTCNDKRYFLLDRWDTDDGNSYLQLYEKEIFSNGRYQVKPLRDGTLCGSVYNFIKYRTENKRPTLSEIDIGYFISRLFEDGYAEYEHGESEVIL